MTEKNPNDCKDVDEHSPRKGNPEYYEKGWKELVDNQMVRRKVGLWMILHFQDAVAITIVDSYAHILESRANEISKKMIEEFGKGFGKLTTKAHVHEHPFQNGESHVGEDVDLVNSDSTNSSVSMMSWAKRTSKHLAKKNFLAETSKMSKTLVMEQIEQVTVNAVRRDSEATKI